MIMDIVIIRVILQIHIVVVLLAFTALARCDLEEHTCVIAADHVCQMCQPGYHVSEDCIQGEPETTVCTPCGTTITNTHSVTYFMETWNYDRSCHQARTCNGRNMQSTPVQAANATHDSICTCNPGYIYIETMHACFQHPVCQEGWGTTDTGVCEQCSNGYFSDERSSSQLCEKQPDCEQFGFVTQWPGNTTSKGVCVESSDGSIVVDISNNNAIDDDRTSLTSISAPPTEFVVGQPVPTNDINDLSAASSDWTHQTSPHYSRDENNKDGLVGPAPNIIPLAIGLGVLIPILFIVLIVLHCHWRRPYKPFWQSDVKTGHSYLYASNLSDSKQGSINLISSKESRREMCLNIACEVVEDLIGKNYKLLARQLHVFSKTDLDAIHIDHEGLKERIHQMLREWREIKGEQATVEELLNALNRCKLNRLCDAINKALVAFVPSDEEIV